MKEPEGGEGRGCKHIWHPRNPADSHNITGGTHRPRRRESAVFLSCHRTCSGRHTHPRNCAPATSAMPKSDYVGTCKKARQFSSWRDISMLAAIVLFIPPDRPTSVLEGPSTAAEEALETMRLLQMCANRREDIHHAEPPRVGSPVFCGAFFAFCVGAGCSH